jgi:putative membrane protein
MMGWYGMGMGWGAWLGMGLFWLVLLGVILYAVVRLLPSGGANGRDRGEDSAEEILDRRFARGEIDVEAYQAQRAALRHARGAK